jgi:TolA-binding protein
MSQLEPTDLLCRSRREELSIDEQRRLNQYLQHSLEVALMSQLLSEFEKESRVRAGDEALLARITVSALGKPQRAPRKRRPLTMLLVAAAVLLMASLASALIGRARQASAPGDSLNFFSDLPWKVAKRARRATVVPSARPVASQTVHTEADPGATGDSQKIPSIPPPSPAPNGSDSARAGSGAKKVPAASAGELFARANLLRRQGHSVEAAGVYRVLLERYPNSREVAPARLALAKYLQAAEPELALAHYRAVAVSGGTLRAEALWGISEVATVLGQRSLAEQALADLMREFPDSSYAAVARARTTHGLP